jgi:hypothetical protein
MRSPLACIALAAALVAAPATSPLAAQQGEPAMIPTSLAIALTAPYTRLFEENPHFVVGRAPGGWPAALVAPAPATLVGGVTFGPMRTAVFQYPATIDPADAYRQLLTRAGYTRGRNPMMPQGGFTSREPLDFATYCGTDGAVTITDADSSAMKRSILVTFVAPPATSPVCGDPASPQRNRLEFPVKLPALVAPPGVTAQPRGTSRSGDEFTTSVHLDTTLSPAATLDHYARQLARAGWTVGKPLTDRTSGLQAITTRDSTGAVWSGALLLFTSGAQRTLQLTMSAAPAAAAGH